MESDNRLIQEPAERLPALLLAAIATFLIFAAINAGFTPQITIFTGAPATQSSP